MKKEIPLLLFIARFWYREDIPNSIPDNMLKALILVGFDKDLLIYFSRNPVKLDRA